MGNSNTNSYEKIKEQAVLAEMELKNTCKPAGHVKYEHSINFYCHFVHPNCCSPGYALGIHLDKGYVLIVSHHAKQIDALLASIKYFGDMTDSSTFPRCYIDKHNEFIEYVKAYKESGHDDINKWEY